MRILKLFICRSVSTNEFETALTLIGSGTNTISLVMSKTNQNIEISVTVLVQNFQIGGYCNLGLLELRTSFAFAVFTLPSTVVLALVEIFRI